MKKGEKTTMRKKIRRKGEEPDLEIKGHSQDDLNQPGNSSTTLNLLDFLGKVEDVPLERVRLDGNETAMLIFTGDGIECEIHYCRESEIGESVHCSGSDCLLCLIGRKKDRRILIPVYLPASQAIGALPVSPSLRPFALLPQIGAILKSGKPLIAFVTREGSKFSVDTRELTQEMDGGEMVIKEFLEKNVGLTSVYPRLANHQLAQVPEIARILKLKGIDPGDLS